LQIFDNQKVRSNNTYFMLKMTLQPYFDPRIQLSRDFMEEIINELFGKNNKVLVFGLGYDSQLWYQANGKKNIFFVEDNQFYIEINSDVSEIVKCDYSAFSVEKSLLGAVDPAKFDVPKSIKFYSPFDVILIDGPHGCSMNSPGRELPFFWSKLMSHDLTKFYIDDLHRPLERMLVDKYFSGYKQLYFPTRCSVRLTKY